MAEIYDGNGNEITVGLQSSSICDEAINQALAIAADWGEPVYLEDDDEKFTVHPDGTVDEGWGWE